MFTPKNIQGALEELYDLCDPDYMVDMLVNYSEEFDDISPALLAKSFQKNAEMIIISGNTAIDASALETMEETLMAMDLGPLAVSKLYLFLMQVFIAS